MKDFVCIDVIPNFHQNHEFLLNEINNDLSQFSWHSNENDSQGRYIRGANKNNISIELWLDEQPVAISISFRQERYSKLSKIEIDNRKSMIVKNILEFANKNIGHARII